MKLRFIILFFILLCLFPAFLAARNVSDITGDKFEETSGRGLEIRTNPAGVRVFINGIDRGTTPVSFDNISAGDHHVRLSRDGYRDRNFNITLFNTSRLVVSIEMEEQYGTAFVTIQRAQGSPSNLPFNLTVSHGRTTVRPVTSAGGVTALLNLPVGQQTIRVRGFGWEDASVTVFVIENTQVKADVIMIPASFRMENLTLSRKRFNPLNSSNLGTTELRFEVTTAATGVMTIVDSNGITVHERQLGVFDSRNISVIWNGKDSLGSPLPQGRYTVTIEAQGQKLSTEIEIDYSIEIFPVSLTGGIPGLTFAALSNTLPAGSYQLNAGINYGKFDTPNFTGFPFVMGLRLSPFNRLEVSTVFNINPDINESTGWGITGSLKYNFVDAGKVPLGFAAGVFYTWSVENGENPLSAGNGAGFYTPLSLEIKKIIITISPYAFWQGPEGLTPQLHLCAGILYRENWFNAGVSSRVELDFENNGKVKYFAGGEARFYPSPSTFFFGAQGGMWGQDSKTGAYGAVEIGFIY